MCCGVLQSVAANGMHARLLARIHKSQCVAVCCNVLQCVAVCCSVLQQIGCMRDCRHTFTKISVLQCVAVGCSVLQCVAVGCSVLHYVAVCCSK